MPNNSHNTPPDRLPGAAREARIQELILAVGQGWYHVPDELLAEAILKRTGITVFLRPARRNPAAP